MLRSRIAELMDDPGLERNLHEHALKELERLNCISANYGSIWKPIRDLARTEPGRPIRVLDIASGGGDTAIALYKMALNEDIDLHVTGLDISGKAIDYAGKRAKEAGVNLQFLKLDALQHELPSGFDVAICSLFMHHLDPDQVVILLRKMGSSVRSLVLVNDLLRSRLNLWIVYLATRLLCRSPIVHYDGPVSVKAAYNREEMLSMSRQAGLNGAEVALRFPCRMLLSWRKI